MTAQRDPPAPPLGPHGQRSKDSTPGDALRSPSAQNLLSIGMIRFVQGEKGSKLVRQCDVRVRITQIPQQSRSRARATSHEQERRGASILAAVLHVHCLGNSAVQGVAALRRRSSISLKTLNICKSATVFPFVILFSCRRTMRVMPCNRSTRSPSSAARQYHSVSSL